jgi:hypothetical protein
MKSITAALLIALLSFSLGLYLPWWTVAVAGGLVALILNLRPVAAFMAGFMAVFVLWGGLALLRSSSNDHILAKRMAAFILKNDNPWMLILLTALIGGLVTGLGALSGSFLRNWQNATRQRL